MQVDERRRQIDFLIADLGLRPPFDAVGAVRPSIGNPELTFLKVTFWLYIHYWESGKVSLGFLERQYPQLVGKSSLIIGEHRTDVQRLRTYFAHNLTSGSPTDRATFSHVLIWFEKACKKMFPEEEDDWNACLDSVCMNAACYFGELLNCVNAVKNSEARDEIVVEWAGRLDRHLDLYQMEEIVSVVVNDIGRQGLDPARLSRRHYDLWSKDLRHCSDDAEIKVEARRLIEATLLAGPTVLPIDGSDLLRELCLSPGPEVGRMLSKARKIYEENPCSAQGLIELLKK